MTDIAKNHGPQGGEGGAAGPDARPGVEPFWLAPGTGLMPRLAQSLRERGVHPAQALVLVPYAQLMVTARRYWAQAFPSGFAPRFETTQNRVRTLGAPLPGGDDYTGDPAHDVLTAQSLLERAGLGAQAPFLAGGLLEAAQQLMRCVAAVMPDEREAWAEAARAALQQGLEAPVLAVEAACARIALEWALASTPPTDVLLADGADEGLCQLVLLEGFQTDPLAEALASRWARRDPGSVTRLALPELWGGAGAVARLHAAHDAEDEAERAAAVVLAHLAAGRAPVALVAIDRAITRRISAMLAERRVPLRDESGWKLSTTRAAAHVMTLLRAVAWGASTDAALDWLKGAPAWRGAALDRLEQRLRRQGVREWRRAAPPEGLEGAEPTPEQALWQSVQAVREALGASRPLPLWLQALRGALQASGQWALLGDDPAGEKLQSVLRLDEAAQGAWLQALADTPWPTRRLDLGEFTVWVHQALESASFMADELPVYIDAQVIVLPLSQLLARPWGAVVLPGCDEQRLPASPEPPGVWTRAQRVALGLPQREALQRAQARAWAHALAQPAVDILWRAGDEGGEPLLASPLVLALQTVPGASTGADDPRSRRALAPAPLAPPQPVGAALPLQRLSASAYEDLRRCPYRFFALRQLGLQESDELEAEIDKRDFGQWLHLALQHFHTRLAEAPEAAPEQRRRWLDEAAASASHEQGLAPEEFLPYAATWPQVREGYLTWLADYEAGEGGRFVQGESWLERPLALGAAVLPLVGQVDRLDQLPQGQLVMDYKTESLQRTRDRLAEPTEDTQLAFYAALLQRPDAAAEGPPLRAAYVNVGEAGLTTLVEQPEVEVLRDQLLAGVVHDLTRIAQGAALPALGDGAVCEHCAARGLCRKDFWSTT